MHPQVHGDGAEPTWLHADVTFVRGDVRATQGWDELLAESRPTVVVHLAAETGTGQSLSDATSHASTNVVGTARLLDELFRAHERPKHIVLTSSRAVYGEGAWSEGGEDFYPPPRGHADLEAGQWEPRGAHGQLASPKASRADRTEPRPCNVYGATKLAQEQILAAWAAATGTAVSVLRLQNVYGPGQSLQNPYTGVVSLFAQLALAGERIELFEDGQMVRDFVFINDVVSALSAAIVRPPTELRTVDIGSGQPTTLEQVAHLLAEIEGAPKPHVSGRFRDGDVRSAWCDITPARADLGYRPEWPVERGLRALLDWVRAQKLPRS